MRLPLSFRGQAALSTWLSRLVLNECAARRRRSVRRDNIVPIVSADPGTAAMARVPDAGEPLERSTARAQMRQVLERKVGELPESLRLVFVMRSIEELSVEEIAATLSVSQDPLRSPHFRAKGRFSESLAQQIDLAEADIYDFGGASCDSEVAGVNAELNRGQTSNPAYCQA